VATATPAAAARPGPGRPSTGARDRIVEAALEILKSDGYGGLTTAKVAARAGQNKALISYHFGSKQGLVTEVAENVAALITDATRVAIADVEDVEQLARAIVEAVFGVMDSDEGLQRVYFDLISQAVVDAEIDRIMRAMKHRFREVLRERLPELGVGPEDRIEAAAVFLIAGVEGLALARLERGNDEELAGARELWVSAVGAALG